MGLIPQNIPISFRQGVDTKDDPKQVIPGSLLSLTNGIFTTGSSISKRNGYQVYPSLASSGALGSSGITLDTVGTAAVATDGTNIWAYSATRGNWQPGITGAYIPLDVYQKTVATPKYPVVWCDSAYLSGYEAYVYLSVYNLTTSPNGYLSVIDRASGCYVQYENFNLSGLPQKIVAFNNKFYIFYGTQYQSLDLGTFVLSSLVSYSGGSYNDTVVTNSRLYIASATGSDIVIQYIDTSGSLNTVTSSLASTSTYVGICGDVSNNDIYVVYGTTALTQTIYNSSGTQLSTSTSSSTGRVVGPVTAAPTNTTGVINIYMNDLANTAFSTTGPQVTLEAYIGGIAGVSTATIISGDVYITNRAFTTHGSSSVSGDTYVVACVPGIPLGYNGQSSVASNILSTSQSGMAFLFKGTALTAPIARLAYESVGFTYTFSNKSAYATSLANTNSISTNVFDFSFINNAGEGGTETTAAGTLISNGLSNESINFFPSYVPRVSLQNNLFLGGGQLTSYDLSGSTEYNFPQCPIVTLTTASGSLAAGSYSVVASYVWFDANGNKYESQPSIAKSITVTGSTKIQITVTTMKQTFKQAGGPGTVAQPVLINVYVTQTNGTTHYLYYQTANNSTLEVISSADVADATKIYSSAISIYTDSGEVENVQPPASCLMCSYRERIMLVPAESRCSFWYSKQILPGFPPEFSDFFVQNITTNGGDIKAIAQMDDKFVLFKANAPNAIYYITGYGPAVNGSNNDFSPEQIVTSPVGTTNPASVVLTQDGLMFQASNGAGIWLLDRSLGVSYIGAPVEAFNSYTITSASLVPNTTQVRFTLDSGTSETLVYDYYYKQWSVFTNINAVASCVYSGVWSYLDSSGVVHQETPGSYTDNGSFIQLSLTTGWLPFAGVQGFQRVREVLILGNYFSSHNLNVQVAFDFSSTYTQNTTVPTSSTIPYEYRVNLNRQKCTAVQFIIQDVNTGVPGQSMSLSSLALDVAVKQGQRRIGPVQSYG